MKLKLNKYFFGINITKYVKDHEDYIESLITEEIGITENKLGYHKQRLKFLQHERFIHLVVTFMTLVAFLMFLMLFLITSTMFNWTFAFLDLILFILFIFYIKHYFFLENHVQYWYILYDKMIELIKEA